MTEKTDGAYRERFDRDPLVRRAAEVAQKRGWSMAYLRDEESRLPAFERVMRNAASKLTERVQSLAGDEEAAKLTLKDVGFRLDSARAELTALLDSLPDRKTA